MHTSYRLPFIGCRRRKKKEIFSFSCLNADYCATCIASKQVPFPPLFLLRACLFNFNLWSDEKNQRITETVCGCGCIYIAYAMVEIGIHFI